MAKPKPMVSSETESRQLGVTQPVEREGKSLRRIWDIRSIQGMSMKDKVVLLVQGDLYGPPKAQKSNVLKRGDKCSKIRFSGNRATRRNLQTLLVQGDLYGQRLQEKIFKT